MKAVLIIDVPDNILLDFSQANIEIKESAYLVSKDENAWKYTRPIKVEDVPLRPLPQKYGAEKDMYSVEDYNYSLGRDDCIDEITGEKDESGISY